MDDGLQEGLGWERSPLPLDEMAWHVLCAVGQERSLPERWRARRPGDEVRAVHELPEALRALGDAYGCDCVVVDLSLPDGTAAAVLRGAKERVPGAIRVAVADPVDAAACNPLVADAMPVFAHPAEPEHFLRLLDASPLAYRARLKRVLRYLAERCRLTVRENEILELRSLGLTRPAICNHLKISAKTYDNHVASLVAKTGAGRTDPLLLELRRRARAPERIWRFDDVAC